MLLLTLEIAGRLYALDAARVVEVAPLVDLQPPLRGPEWLAGRMLYRGQLVSVVDLVRLLTGAPAPQLYSTRIVVTRLAAGALLAVIAPMALETIRVQPSDLRAPALDLSSVPYLGDELLQPRGVIQCLQLDWFAHAHGQETPEQRDRA